MLIIYKGQLKNIPASNAKSLLNRGLATLPEVEKPEKAEKKVTKTKTIKKGRPKK